jgi:hypothetical protein
MEFIETSFFYINLRNGCKEEVKGKVPVSLRQKCEMKGNHDVQMCKARKPCYQEEEKVKNY